MGLWSNVFYYGTIFVGTIVTTLASFAASDIGQQYDNDAIWEKAEKARDKLQTREEQEYPMLVIEGEEKDTIVRE